MYVEYVQAHPVVSLQLGTTFWASHFLLEKSTVVVIAFYTVDIDQPELQQVNKYFNISHHVHTGGVHI